ncbi:flagellar motor switch protein FliN [Pedococcus sp. KACC 23699]|uniref:Flagellar motor switch protein FliN n=1 Tax=Pedococcus sp. KACC 23699 TaxID=3149228 RepID=A0AAU7JYS3_9MICO
MTYSETPVEDAPFAVAPERPVQDTVEASVEDTVEDTAAVAAAFQPLVGGSPFAEVDPRRLHLLRDVEMGISVELGRTRMKVQEVLSLAPGVVLELDRAAGSPVDVLVNGTLMARGEVVVVDEEFAVRITEVVSADTDSRPRA